jgi:excisionase family DNA binding protein
MAEKEYTALREQIDELRRLLLAGTKEVLTIDECAILTGYSKNHLYKLTSQRAIPFYKPLGGSIRFKKSEVEDWLLQNRQATISEINSLATTYCVTNK